MPKSVKRLSDDIMLYLFDLETDSDFRSNRPEIIRLQHATGKRKRRPESRRSFNLGDMPLRPGRYPVCAAPGRNRSCRDASASACWPRR
ncbi:hypothetical protein FJW07_22270 [Mesorhizobium sp. B3-1-9]|nr:hypothetical protein FJW07_22270 [Mesorhizobium sp. B3-1-9]